MIKFISKCLLIFLTLSSILTAGRKLSELSTQFDEFPVFFDGKRLIFVRNEGGTFKPYEALFDGKKFTNIKQFSAPKSYFKFKGNFLASYFDETSSKEIIAFSGSYGKDPLPKIFVSEKVGKSFTKPQVLPFCINGSFITPQIDLHKKIILFATDRDGTRGGTDIAYSFLNAEDPYIIKFFESEINTESNEITPFLDSDGNLYFARNENGSFNLYKAERISVNRWGNTKPLPNFINSEADEIAPIVAEGKLLFATNREGTSFDIYLFELCLPVSLEVKFEEDAKIFSSFDRVFVFDEQGTLLADKYLEPDGSFRINLIPKMKYFVEIINECNGHRYFSKSFETICNDSSVTQYRIELNVSNDLTKEIDVPFFVTGFYKPITRKNLLDLRRLFDFNFLGLDDSTKYIERPDSTYDLLSPKVEHSLEEIVSFIQKYLELFDKGCIAEGKRLIVEVIGYADPRSLSEKARFFEETIDDRRFSFILQRGSSLDNYILSRLRAYYTAREIEQSLVHKLSSNDWLQHISWDIQAGGVADEDEDNYLYKRKVQIKIRID